MENQLVEKSLGRNGCTLRYWVSELPGRPWLVLLHGAGADHRMFAAQLPLLASKYSLLLPDQRGQGLSRPMSGELSASTFVDDTLALLDCEGISRAVFIGQSMGGNLAQEVAYRHPGRVQALVFIDCTCNTMRLTALEKFSLKMSGPMLAAYPWKTLVRQSALASSVDPCVREYLKQALELVGKKDFNSIMAATTGFLHHDEAYRLGKPMLLVCGERDGTGNIRKCAPNWAAREPGCEFHMIADAGHCSNMDNPEEFNKILEGFLERQVSALLAWIGNK